MRTYVRGMEWRDAANDQIDEALDHFAGLSAAATARVCDLVAPRRYTHLIYRQMKDLLS